VPREVKPALQQPEMTGGSHRMSIITISRGSYSKGSEVAEKVSARLGYECISREVLLEASKEFNVPEIMLARAIHDAPSILDRIGYKKDHYIAFIWAALLQHFKKGNVVYCGLAGHFFVKDIPHVLKIRVNADLDLRVRSEVEREGVPRKEALRVIRHDDEERRKWSQYLYGINTSDPSLYDMVIHIGNISTEDAAAIICNTVALDTFKTTPESQEAIEDIAIAAQVKAALMDLAPDVDVVASHGVVQIHTAALLFEENSVVEEIQAIAKAIDGVKITKLGVKP
jgi:cytidylate kinase